MLTFREDSVENVVDDWLGPTSAPKAANAARSIELPSKTNQRLGLGFQGSKKQSTHNLAAKKDQKRARSDEIVGDLHGVIEDDVDDSKLSAVAKKPKTQDTAKKTPHNSAKKEVKTVSNNDNTISNVDITGSAISSSAPRPSHPFSGRGSQGVHQGDGGRGGSHGGRGRGDGRGRGGGGRDIGIMKDRIIDRGEVIMLHDKNASSNNHTQPPSNPTPNPASPSIPNPDAPLKRKRSKTRSKQKNIRRDHRTDDQKPAHLHLSNITADGSSGEYKGRVLTEETKRRLNIV
eukprot:gene39935-48636_t